MNLMKLLLVLWLTALTSCANAGSAPVSDEPSIPTAEVLPVPIIVDVSKQYKKARLNAARLVYRGSVCSGTKVYKDIILTATHCLDENQDLLTVDQETFTIEAILDDGNDHALIKLSGANFTTFATVTALIPQGDVAYYWGNPASLDMLFRKTVFIGVDRELLLFDGNVFFGDSGAGMHDTNGSVIAVVSTLQLYFKGEFRLLGAFPFNFKEEDLIAIGMKPNPNLSTGVDASERRAALIPPPSLTR